MKRAIFKFTNGEHINIPADGLDLQDGVYRAWDGEYVVAYAKEELVEVVYISEQKENKNEKDNK